jgi:glycosyltransferase involved in cell wall biosynthesis
VNGLLVPAADEMFLERQIRRMLEDCTSSIFAKKAYADVCKKFGVKRNINSYESLYHELFDIES